MLAVPLLVALSAAQAQVPVLVSHFEPLTPDDTEIATRVPELIEEDLLDYPDDFRVIDIERAGEVGGHSANLYMRSCPPGDIEGCTFVVAQAAGAAYAITGRVRDVKQAEDLKLDLEEGELEEGDAPARAFDDALAEEDAEPEIVAQVDVYLLDVEDSRRAVNFTVPYTSHAEGNFAAGVSFVLLGVLEGEVGQSIDIRVEKARKANDPDAEVREQFAQELEELEQEMGEMEAPVEEEDEGPHREFRAHYTLEEMREKEAGLNPPWEPLGITDREYVQWWNSGWDFDTWYDFLQGRNGQFLLRPYLGLVNAPADILYRGQHAVERNSLDHLETYAWQSVQNAWTASLGLSAGYGFSALVEGELFFERLGGVYEVNVTETIYGDEDSSPLHQKTYRQSTWSWGLGARYTPMPGASMRPVAGLAMQLWHGSALTAHTDLSEDHMPEFSAPTLVGARLLGGAEFRVHPMIDVVAEVPMHLLIAGNRFETYSEAEQYTFIPDKATADPQSRFGAGLRVAAQFRFGGDFESPPTKVVEPDEDSLESDLDSDPLEDF